MAKREFRSQESYEFERVTRNMLPEYIRSKGFRGVDDQRQRHGSNESQIIVATTPEGAAVKLKVRLCWRRGGQDARGVRPYSAAQLLSSISNDDWEGSIRAKIEREAEQDVTHFLLVQRDDERITFAASLPLSSVLAIWCAQRDISARLTQAGQLGRIRSNHAMNGRSPTLYLQEDRAPEVAAALWDYPGVTDLADLPPSPGSQHQTSPDSQYHTGRGAGFGSPAENKLVEAAAVNEVRKQYAHDGWTVRSVERDRCGYDLECQKREAIEHVEVKGVRGSELSFQVTAGEARRAETDPAFVLIVVTSALSKSPKQARFTGMDFLGAFELAPVQYRAVLRRQPPHAEPF